MEKSVKRAISRHSAGGVIHCSQKLFNQLAKDFPTKIALAMPITIDGEKMGVIGVWEDNVKMWLNEDLPDWVMEVEADGEVRHVLIYPRTPVHDGRLSGCLLAPCAVRTVMED